MLTTYIQRCMQHYHLSSDNTMKYEENYINAPGTFRLNESLQCKMQSRFTIALKKVTYF